MAASMKTLRLVTIRKIQWNFYSPSTHIYVGSKGYPALEAAFPIIKLATLATKQISKPIAKSLKSLAKSNYLFGRYICAPPAQVYHWMEVNLKMRILGLGRAADVAKLSEEAAIELGADMISELFIFGVAVGTLAFEYWRQSMKEEKHENTQSLAIENLQKRVEELGVEVANQDAKIRELNRMVLNPTTKQKGS